MRLLLAGGGTGGHLFPAVALAEELLRQEPEATVQFVGTERGLEATLIPRLGYPLSLVDIHGVMGRGLFAKLALLPKLLKSLAQARRILRDFRPDVVVGVGGYASAPVLLAARLSGIPYLVHEQNAQPGLTNRLLGRWARTVCLSFPDSDQGFPGGRTVVTGNPLRHGMEDCPEELTENPSLLVFGGSQGAQAINRAMTEALPLLENWRDKLEVLHQTGEKDRQQVEEAYRRQGWKKARVVSFIDDMATAYAGAQLVLCRAGATTLAELTVCGRPALLVPFPHAAGDHQTANARALEARGAASLLPQASLTAESLAETLSARLTHREQLVRMAAAARSLGQRGAAAAILDLCRQSAGKA